MEMVRVGKPPNCLEKKNYDDIPNTEWPASFELFALWALVFPVFLTSKMFFFFPGSSNGEGEPKNRHEHFSIWVLILVKGASHNELCDKSSRFCTFHIDTHPRRRHPIHAPQPHLSQIQSVREHFHHESPVRTGTPRHRRDGWLWHGQQEDRDHAGLAAVDEAVVVPLKDTAQKRHSHVTRHSIALSTDTDSTTNASFARQVVEHEGSVGALTMSYMSTASCRHIAQGRC